MKRGYILLETVIAGGIVSIALATSVTMVASSRFESSMAAKRSEASSLALGIAEQLMTGSEVGSQAMAPVPNHAGFRAGFDVVETPALRSASVPALASDDSIDLITVTVEYPTSRGPATFVYQRLRRQVL
ncbi:MAG: hypothetical protein Q8O67_32425 [Deltaproteobacteria bacterium]|nr:hypothetical protein [Deltaproteobacteria bacterium]